MESVDIKNVISRINRLTPKEKLHILNILKTHHAEFTKNSNGFFFNMTQVPDQVICKMQRCLELIEENRDVIKEMDQRREEILVYYRNLIEAKLRASLKERQQDYVNKLVLHPQSTAVTCHFVQKHRPRQNELLDPDVLMKEHYKSQKFAKGSVLSRLMQRFKSNSITTHKRNVDKKAQEQYTPQNEEEADEVVAELEEDDVVELSDIVSVDDYVDDDVEVEGHESDVESETSDVSEIEQVETVENEVEVDESNRVLNYYKRILNQQGYKFDENVQCHLVCEPYIE